MLVGLPHLVPLPCLPRTECQRGISEARVTFILHILIPFHSYTINSSPFLFLTKFESVPKGGKVKTAQNKTNFKNSRDWGCGAGGLHSDLAGPAAASWTPVACKSCSLWVLSLEEIRRQAGSETSRSSTCSNKRPGRVTRRPPERARVPCCVLTVLAGLQAPFCPVNSTDSPIVRQIWNVHPVHARLCI